MPLQAQFHSLIVKHRRDVAKLANRLKSGAIDAQGFGDGLHAIVTHGHAEAMRLGRALAGNHLPEDIALLAGDRADTEATWLNKFVADIEDGRYTLEDGSLNVDAVARRGDMYAVKYRHTANEAFVDASEPDEQWHWRKTALESCEDCVLLAHASPLTRDELYTTPGGCDTACLLGCKCYLERYSDGLVGFRV